MGTEAANLNTTSDMNSGTNTYEIFLQPNFRENYDAWQDTPLEQMDNRNMTKEEKA